MRREHFLYVAGGLPQAAPSQSLRQQDSEARIARHFAYIEIHLSVHLNLPTIEIL